MKRQGMFYSISILIFLVFIILIFTARSDIYKAKDVAYTDRAKLITTNHFVNDFEARYVHIILSSAAKPALASIVDISPIDPVDLVDVMTDGNLGAMPKMNPVYSTDNSYQQALYTLSYRPVNNFTYRVASIRQHSYDKIQIEFLVDYSFSAFDTNWSDVNIPVKVTFQLQGLKHPRQSLQIIKDDWIEDIAGNGCYATDVFSSIPGVPVSCGTSNNILPP